jgi:hypothetical protein
MVRWWKGKCDGMFVRGEPSLKVCVIASLEEVCVCVAGDDATVVSLIRILDVVVVSLIRILFISFIREMMSIVLRGEVIFSFVVACFSD